MYKRQVGCVWVRWSVGPTEFVSGEGKESRPAPAKECPECHAIVPAATTVCPECGYQFPAPEPEETLDGHLVQLLRSDYGRMSTQQLAEAMGDVIGLRYGREIGWGCACEIATEKAGDLGRLDLTYTIANAIWKQWDDLGILDALGAARWHPTELTPIKSRRQKHLSLARVLVHRMEEAWRSSRNGSAV